MVVILLQFVSRKKIHHHIIPIIKIYTIVVLETVDINISVVYHSLQNWASALSFIQLLSAASLQCFFSFKTKKLYLFWCIINFIFYRTTFWELLRVYINPWMSYSLNLMSHLCPACQRESIRFLRSGLVRWFLNIRFLKITNMFFLTRQSFVYSQFNPEEINNDSLKNTQVKISFKTWPCKTKANFLWLNICSF